MCGIYGKFLFNEYLDIESSCNALSQLTHRGPDGYGYEVGSIANNDYYINHNGKYVVGNEILETDYFLGHRRLSIVDLNDNAFQPMETQDKRYSIIFNGEIFNYIELRKELTELGCQFSTDHSDTEVLLNAYATWKEDCFKKLRGMFAFAIFDRQNSSLILARDRIGQKTLYYDLSDSGFSFSSELPPLLNKNSPRKLSKEAINNYMLLGYVPHPYSIFEGINKLPPASYALIDLNSKKIDIEEYWDIDGVIDNGKTDEEYLNLVNEALSESVELRLRADVSIGAFISGGTDSTLIIKKMKEVGKDKYDVYGADFPDTDRSEKKYIVEASDTYSQNLHLSSIDTSHIKNTDSIISIFDEPFDGASSIAVHELFKTAAKSHKVILTGDGGDELFAGYLRYQDFKQRYNRIRLLKNMILPSLFAKLAIKMGIKNRKISKIYSVLKGDLLTTYAHINTELDLTNIIKPAFRVDDIFNLEPFSSTRSKICRKKLPLIKSLQYWELKTILPGRMLYKVDRFSMFHGVEARSPFMDHKLVEKAFSIPDEVNISNGESKRILKKILEQDFDSSFVYRKKQGFGNPLSRWFYSPNSKEMFSELLNRNSLIFKYLDYDELHDTFPQIKKGYNGEGEKLLWRLIVFSKFIEKHENYIHEEC